MFGVHHIGGDGVEEGATIGVGQVKDHCKVIGLADAADLRGGPFVILLAAHHHQHQIFGVGPERILVAGNVIGKDHIVGGKGGTVMPGDPFAQDKGAAIAIKSPTLGQVGQEIAIIIVPLDQPAIGQPARIDILRAGIVPRHTKVAVGGLLWVAEDQRPAAGGRRRRGAFAGCRCGWRVPWRRRYTSGQQTSAGAHRRYL